MSFVPYIQYNCIFLAYYIFPLVNFCKFLQNNICIYMKETKTPLITAQWHHYLCNPSLPLVVPVMPDDVHVHTESFSGHLGEVSLKPSPTCFLRCASHQIKDLQDRFVFRNITLLHCYVSCNSLSWWILRSLVPDNSGQYVMFCSSSTLIKLLIQLCFVQFSHINHGWMFQRERTRGKWRKK